VARYDQDWCDRLTAAVGAQNGDQAEMRLLYVITDTEDGKVAFHLDLAKGGIVCATHGRVPRGQDKADVTVTAKEPVARELWMGERTRDAAFMRGDLKIEGAYERWLDELVPLFSADPWASAWSAGAA